MWGSGGARRPGGFKRFNDYKDGTSWSVNDVNRPKLSFTMKAQYKGRGRARPLDWMMRGIPDENLMSIGSDHDSSPRIVRKIRCGVDGSPYHREYSTMSGSAERYVGNPSHGYRIIVWCNRKCDKEFILNSLRNLIAPETFVPIMYKATTCAATFYVDEQRISEMLGDYEGKSWEIGGFRMRVRVTAGFPRYELDDTLRERMASAIAKKYVPDRNALDLSRFHHNPDLVDDYYCSLTRVPILNTALKILVKSLPNLVEISLDNNQIYSLDKLGLLTKLPNLKILGICDNKIKKVDQLYAIQDLKLEELRLAGNPVSESYNGRHPEYVRDVQKIFPDLLRLDGVAMPTVIGFDVASDRIAMPPRQIIFSPNDQAKEIAGGFLQEYFRVFDSDNRQPLLNAYDELACFSMTVSQLWAKYMPETYLPNSRNLCKVQDDARRRKMLKQGRLSVVACISELPRVQHDLNSFTMDICLVTDKMMVVTVTGIFRETEAADQPIRYFTRTFIITPKGAGYCIINEMLHITRPTKAQEKEAFRTNSSTTTETAATTTSTPVTAMDDDVKAQMIAALRERTNMTLEWTLKCLNDVRWDFDTALAAFQDCHARGAIPPDAFEK